MGHFRLTQINWRVKRVYCGLRGLTRLWHVSYRVAFRSTHLYVEKTHVGFVLCLQVGLNIDTPRVAITMIDMTLSVFRRNVQLVFMWQITWKFLCIIFVLLPLWNCIYVALGFCFKFFSSIVVKSCIYCVFVLLKCCLNKKGGTFPHLDSYFHIGQSLVTKLVVVLSYNLT